MQLYALLALDVDSGSSGPGLCDVPKRLWAEISV